MVHFGRLDRRNKELERENAGLRIRNDELRTMFFRVVRNCRRAEVERDEARAMYSHVCAEYNVPLCPDE